MFIMLQIYTVKKNTIDCALKNSNNVTFLKQLLMFTSCVIS